MAAAYKIDGELVTERETLKDALQRMWDSENTYLLEIKVAPKGNVFPMVPSGAAVDEILYGDERK